MATSPGAEAKYASIVVDAKTGRVLYSVNSNTKNYPASLTKIMTLFITFDAVKTGLLSLRQKLPVSRVAESRSPSRLGLRRGDTISVENAIKALATKSANDIATVLAESIGGTERKFAKIMTRRARSLGMKNTTFRNASGLPNRGQLSSAKDMATLARALLNRHPDMYHYFSKKTFTYNGLTYRTHNKLMSRYRGMDGIKTGYIRASGFNLVASAKRAHNRVIGVVFGGQTPRSRDRHMKRLLDKGFKALNNARPISSVSERITLPKMGTNRTIVSQKLGKYTAQLASRNKAVKRPRYTITKAEKNIRGWAVQVGAYNRYTPARRAIERAAKAVPSLIGKKYRVLRHKSKLRRGLSIFKARLIVGSKSRASNSCRALKRRKIDCMVVWMGRKSR
ncbi:MAG: D-alanyl-D-alanine carboxypeptidase family protein [Pseudomonadota bacterium]|nr:D-alanyl-D-alanine carboxypeptidase family protein [Pseudomonadota bacterium]